MPNDMLPPLNPFAARSTWLIIFAFAVPTLNRFGYFPAEWFGLERGDSVGLLDLLWPLILTLLAARERRAPQRRLTFTGPMQ